ncbi:conserved protein, unknown function [Plasmodium malariae]|uniref:Uncharacterized protein n=1 Tax=Plasmodium malariae TaxID=5858 RepID=A0A1D3PBQ4_PLAMA|nr:conserved protein, unknown function [Plasmodium malariae]SCN12712.1 conserved protein, unknown function [Plasmodium malariae]
MVDVNENLKKPLSRKERRKILKKKKIHEKSKKDMVEAKSNIESIFSTVINVKDKENSCKKVKEDGEIKKKNNNNNSLEGKKHVTRIKKNNEKSKEVLKQKAIERLRTPDGLPIYSMEELKMAEEDTQKIAHSTVTVVFKIFDWKREF